ncbi:NAD(P)-dependent alcohol dehydrogenase [Planomonospora sp. ID91781]|uniref:NADPH:quinone oxidoreductase n=1 Tax=Planomonospora sphaerica TaxID=161355 RepID=A0A171CS99_9ACTN|nr:MULTISPECIES: NAD(P)-dependent alcohol dehydrogenase [Planomonospora]MBG0823444.1 NAD(P)-dependent alcohol dehydrogenase [Planomonospora sp. ID91781]GAT67138.1 NADPH:quinone oxidoreductase [Planomonospora sphaerica]
MRYYHLPEFGGVDALRLGERDEPRPGPRQVLVRMRAWSLNHRDLLIARAAYGRDVRPGVVPLSDGAGEVAATGDGVTRWRPGDRVAGTVIPRWTAGPPTAEKVAGMLGGSLDGVLAEYVVFDEEALVAVPAHLSLLEAATLPCAAVTAWHALVEVGGLRPGQRLLTLGSGGVSLFALQLAAAGGAHVTATSGSADKLDRLRGLGAADVVDHAADPGWGATVHERTGGVDHVIEVGGAGTLRQSITAARTGGRISVIGVLSRGEGVGPVPLLRKALTVQGVLVGSREMFEELNRALERHRIHPVVDSVFPFSDAAAAYRRLASGRHVGKVVIGAD